MSPRHGITIPLPGALPDQREWFELLEELGYTDVWSAEANGNDGLTPLALAAAWSPSLRLGTAILPVYTRGPALLAQSAATMAALAPGRFVLGIGSSSDVIVERWNGVPFTEPYRRVRDTVRFLRVALTGEKVTEDYGTFAVDGFRLGLVPEQPPRILVAALREGMLRLAGREGDGAIVNWLSAEDVRTVAGIVDAQGPDKEIVARIFVCPNPDREVVYPLAKRSMAAYLNVPVYRAFHEWLGRGELLGAHWERWEAGDRAGALDEIPDSLVDDLIVHGTPDDCRAHIDRYVANGVTTPALLVMPFGGIDVRQAVIDLAPR
ncbi:MAG: LLM class F420-dependent oxidoreductase [Acidimicrobiales bacterium]|nr:LLM class F420-dependent oxidoreductase [Acidimicrobiales bacterium]